MRLAIYGKNPEQHDIPILLDILAFLKQKNVFVSLESKMAGLAGKITPLPETPLFGHAADLAAQRIDCLVSLGGDGTLLDTLRFVKATSIPVLGINMGRLGFLAQSPKESAVEVLGQLLQGQYRIEKRTLLELKSNDNIFPSYQYALNDFTVHKRDTASMISIETYMNGEFFNTYWADGLIVATPTGSTAYSLSCGGPVIFPDSSTFAVTPVAPHNLTIRPIIVSDNTVISFKVEGRGATHLISLDSRYEAIAYTREIAVQKAPFFFNLVKLNGQNFINTLREKLKWGLDNRNL
ncbi:MAG: NAD kinase [Bacteroidota bacterium]|nr:NAD kinase [Bacteroidota bacterium]